jgi:integrase
VFGDFDGAASKPGTRHLSLPDVARLVAALPRERAAVVAFLVAFGADWSSVLVAAPGDIDLEAGTALIRGTKTETRWRRLPILAPFRKLAKLAAAGLPFKPWGNVRRDLAVACRRLGLERVTPRDLRRSHGQALRALGVEPQLIAPMLGHVDSRMVERVYGRITPEALGSLMRARTGTPTVRKKPAARASKRMH